jgi:hypothetical protein
MRIMRSVPKVFWQAKLRKIDGFLIDERLNRDLVKNHSANSHS